MFLGSYKPSFDVKSRRIALPKKVRIYLDGNETILSFGFEKCIFGFSKQQWEAEASRQLSNPLTDKKSRDIRRFLYSSAQQVTGDEQGRYILPEELCRYANINQPVVIGAGDHFEIWDEEQWDKERKNLERVVL